MGCGIVKLVPVPDLTVVESFQGRAAGDYKMKRDPWDLSEIRLFRTLIVYFGLITQNCTRRLSFF